MPPPEHFKVRRKSAAQPKEASPVTGPRRADLASPRGPHGETTVKDKIKKWQAQGAGAFGVDDEAVIDVDLEGPSASGSHSHVRSRDSSPVKDAFVRKVAEPVVPKVETPKKRVISDGHWVRKVPPPAPPPEPKPKVVKPEVVWTRKPIKKTDEEIPVIPIGPGIALAGAGSPVKKRRSSRPSVDKANDQTPERKPSGIEAWALEVHPTPVHSRAGSRQASESGNTVSQVHSEPKKRKPRISDVSWAAGDENIDIVDFARPAPRAPRAKTVVDTRDVRERAKELVSSRRDKARDKEQEEALRARQRLLSATPTPPAPLRVKGRSVAESPPAIEIRRPRTPPSAPPAIEKYTSRRASRQEDMSEDGGRSAGRSSPRASSAKQSKADDLAREAELRRLSRSMRERQIEDRHQFTKPETISAADEANEVELRRLKRSLRERKPSYTPSNTDEQTIDNVTPKSRKASGSKLTHTRLQAEPPMVANAAPVPIPKVFGSRLDAWLAGAGDPFLDDGGSSSAPSLTHTASTVDSAISGIIADSIAPSEAISNAEARRERERRRARLREAYDPKLAPKPLSIEKSSPKTAETPATPTTPKTPKTPASIKEIDSEISVQQEPSTPGSGSTLRRRGAHKASHSGVRSRLGSPKPDPASPSEPSTPKDDGFVTPPPPPTHSTPSTADDVVAALRASSQGSLPGDEGVNITNPPRPSFPVRRAFPTTGKRLSTIASVETMNTRMQNMPPEIAEGSEVVSTIQPHAEQTTTDASRRKSSRKSTSLKRKLTKHDDLMSALSLPNTGQSLASARSIRTGRSRLTDATINSLMEELVADEKKYMRELRTLVDGVIPVLLSCVLSNNDPAAAASLFGGRAQDEANVTKPIVEMGVTLERLKTCHKRTPLSGPGALLTWAETAEKNYAEYLKTWRLGFKDVVVNLAPADPNAKDNAWEERMPQNEDGDVVDENGERVDVAYLLKRPLVRLKYLARTLKGINMLEPSERASKLAAAYQGLVEQARERMNEERARLEDEAAASIDPSRTRELKTMEPLSGVHIDPQGFVKARDCFDMHLLHSSGQEIDCRVEIFLRDGTAGQAGTTRDGDILISEVDALGRWLLFPPIKRDQVSARLGDANDKLVVMIRGASSDGKQWHELLDLTCDDPPAAQDWLSMLGTAPKPPKLDRSQSFASLKGPASSHAASSVASSYLSASTAATSVYASSAASQSLAEVPIGEKAGTGSKRWSAAHGKHQDDPWRQRKPSYEGNEYEGEAEYAGDWSFKSFKAAFRSLAGKDEMLKKGSPPRHPTRDDAGPRDRFASLSHNERPEVSGRDASGSPRARQSSRRKTSASAPTTPAAKNANKGYSVWYPPSQDNSSESEGDEDVLPSAKSKPSRPQLDRRASSVPSKDLPTIPKLRRSSQAVPTSPIDSVSESRTRDSRASTEPPMTPSPKLAKTAPARYRNTSRSPSPERKAGPSLPPHDASPKASKRLSAGSSSPKLDPPSKASRSNHRRTSSPLKHEYQPSIASCSDGEDHASEDGYSSSDSELDDDDVPLAMLPHLVGNALKPPTPPETLYSPDKGTVAPSQSASQAPYRTVPQGTSKAARAIASIHTWSDKGFWEPLHPDECNIVVTPGLIEVFELSAAPFLNRLYGDDGVQTPSDISVDKPRPLVALGLTPIVPLRRGTAVDISIRSPALDDSLLKTQAGQNVMLRSRSPEECEVLYHSINYARINNPTWIALQNARGPDPNTSWAARMDRQNSIRVDNAAAGNESLWSFGRRKSYRAKASRAASTSAMSTSTVGTTASLFSAMRRFSTGGRVFSISKSSVSWRNSTGGSTDSLSGSGNSGSSTPPLGGANKRNSIMGATDSVELPPGTIAMMKVRLYVREVVGSRWRDLGQCKLNIMQPQSAVAPGSPIREAPTPGSASSAPTTSSGGSGGVASAPAILQPTMNDHSPRALQGGMQKRILVQGKGKGETLLDVTLGESCFERVARTGIAVSVWERLQGEVAARGGVVPGTVRTYMLQTRTERECAYAFSLLGRLRY